MNIMDFTTTPKQMKMEPEKLPVEASSRLKEYR